MITKLLCFRLKDWEVEINADSTDPALLKVENEFDLEGPPRHMTYINKYMVISSLRKILCGMTQNPLKIGFKLVFITILAFARHH